MSITSKDIARIAGVSQATVSRCLNDSPLISEETKNAVRKIALEQGFEFNANARSLSTNKTGTIGVIYPENFSDFSNNLYLNSLHNQLRDRLEKENLDLMLSFAKNHYTGESNIKKLVARKKVDGLIIVRNELDQETLGFLKKMKVPFVFMHHYIDLTDDYDFDVVGTDHEQGGYMAGQYLLELGHRNFLSISAHGTGHEFNQRTKGFIAALRDNGIKYDEKQVLYGNMTFQSGYDIIKNDSNITKGITAMFVQNDIMALGVIQALKEQNIKVPEDISVIGYDDIELCDYFHPYLTTIHQPREEVAMLTCDRLVDLIHSKRSREKKKVIIQPRLVKRASCSEI